MELWGIANGSFLWMYAGAFTVAVGISFLMRRRIYCASVPQGAPLSIAELAYVIGGRKRVVETTIAGMIEAGRLRVDSEGVLHGTSASCDKNLEILVLKALRDQGIEGFRKAHYLRDDWAFNKTGTYIEERLVERGLIYAESSYQKLMIHLPTLVVFGIGVVRLGHSIQSDGPIVGLAVLLGVSLLMMLIRLNPVPGTTQAGYELKTQAEGLEPDEVSRTLPVVELTGAAEFVVLGGLAAYPDTTIAEALASR